MTLPPALQHSFGHYRTQDIEGEIAQGEAERRDILRAFTLDHWHSLPLERYALGITDASPTFCQWLEFKSKHLGKIGGGNASKHIIYKGNDGMWHYPPAYDDVQSAWQALRSAYLHAFEFARDTRWAEIDAISLLREKAVLVKALHLYFPSRIIPIYSHAHLQHFLRLFDVSETSVRDYGRVQLNRALLQATQHCAEFDGYSTNEIAKFLYVAYPPINTSNLSAAMSTQSSVVQEERAIYTSHNPHSPVPRYYKISPGEGARQWVNWLSRGYIGIGWGELGDLRGVDRTEFELRMSRLTERDPSHFAKMGMEQVWRFRHLRVGDRIMANRGKTTVLGTGTVTGEYYFEPNTQNQPHRLPVRWDDQIERVVDQPGWQRTLIELDADTFERIFLQTANATYLMDDNEDELVQIQPEYHLEACAADTYLPVATLEQWKSGIERKRQAVFYGPPGTGKTYLAKAIAKHLVAGGNGFVEIVQFHPAYAYEDFVQGIRPRVIEGKLDYPLIDGAFVRFCKRAQKRSGHCVMIIDELNRANLSRVFGEMMLLLEYRNESIALASGEVFSIPSNVIVLGTMNTADRSIALVDHALRRRFAFIALQPNFDTLRGFFAQSKYKAPPIVLIEKLIALIQRVNRHIGDVHYALGTSFFMQNDLPAQLSNIWQMEIEPYLEEIFFDQPERVDEFRWANVKSELIP
jgi:hypothetical protein